MSEWFVTEKFSISFSPNIKSDISWISTTTTPLEAYFWNYTSDNNEDVNNLEFYKSVV